MSQPHDIVSYGSFGMFKPVFCNFKSFRFLSRRSELLTLTISHKNWLFYDQLTIQKESFPESVNSLGNLPNFDSSLRRDRNRKFPKLPKIGLNIPKLSDDTILCDSGSFQAR